MTPASSGLGTHGSALVHYPNGGGPQDGKRLCQNRGASESGVEEQTLAGGMESMALDIIGEKHSEGPVLMEESAGR